MSIEVCSETLPLCTGWLPHLTGGIWCSSVPNGCNLNVAVVGSNLVSAFLLASPLGLGLQLNISSMENREQGLLFRINLKLTWHKTHKSIKQRIILNTLGYKSASILEIKILSQMLYTFICIPYRSLKIVVFANIPLRKFPSVFLSPSTLPSFLPPFLPFLAFVRRWKKIQIGNEILMGFPFVKFA